ncbi:hypothetical protein [Streptomyces sp. AcE210]|uniref:hypothetical protein n=1 Tax=Streptomyces sp. AcE210 TaxID=2292703 RepID=UPI001058BAC1|nr:hypothetical protein [Streptomyces sp. AcE210]
MQEQGQLEMRSNARIAGNRIDETGEGAAGIRNMGTLVMRGTSSVENNTVTSHLVDHPEPTGSILLGGTAAGIATPAQELPGPGQ